MLFQCLGKGIFTLCLLSIFFIIPQGANADSPNSKPLSNIESSNSTFKRGIEYYLDKQYEKAELIFRQCVRTEPKNAEYMCWLAQTMGFLLAEQAMQGVSNLTLLPDGRRVKNLYQEAMKADPHNERARIGYAIILRDIPAILGGSVDKAEKLLKSVLDDNPNNIFAYHHLGTLYIRKRHELQKGMDYLEKVISIAEAKQLTVEEKLKLDNTYHALGKTYLDELRKPEKAIPYFEKAVDLDGASVVELIDLSNAYFMKDHVSKAKDCLQKAAQIVKKNKYKHFSSQLNELAEKMNTEVDLGFS